MLVTQAIPAIDTQKTQSRPSIMTTSSLELECRSSPSMDQAFANMSQSDREVIQHEICRYLGNDATVRYAVH
jgi:hypothetical protein